MSWEKGSAVKNARFVAARGGAVSLVFCSGRAIAARASESTGARSQPVSASQLSSSAAKSGRKAFKPQFFGVRGRRGVFRADKSIGGYFTKGASGCYLLLVSFHNSWYRRHSGLLRSLATFYGAPALPPAVRSERCAAPELACPTYLLKNISTCVERSKLVDQGQLAPALAAWKESDPAAFDDAELLAAKLVDAKLLTRWQCDNCS